ncbi:MAG TPA: hypothetical protein VFX96_07680 [Pyrinomonadaceae bacterium]|nr:hypothetical protein [Pyrinomonadaceae bacterium]
MTDDASRNRALVRYLLLPTLFLTVALLGGLRVAAEGGALEFVAPPLITLVLAVLLVLLAVRGRMVELGAWLDARHSPLTNVAHALTLGALFFASAQAFNSVLPERGLLHWMFSFFFLWTLWSYLPAPFDARRTLRSLAFLFATAFVLKHLLLASLYEPGGGLLKRLAGVALEGVTLGTLDAPAHAPATGYISFFTLALYVGGLALLPAAPLEDERGPLRVEERERARPTLPPAEADAAARLEDAEALDASAEDEDERTLVSRNK